MTINRVKGTRDFYPEDWAHQRWLSNQLISVGRLFGYEEFEGPILEPIELYLDKTSEEIVNQQTFGLTDRDGKSLVMRPELTPSLARMVAEREGQLTFPKRAPNSSRAWSRSSSLTAWRSSSVSRATVR